MSKIDLSKLSANELEQIAKEAKAEAKIKKKQEADELYKLVGKIVVKNIDKILKSGIDSDIKNELIKMTGGSIQDQQKTKHETESAITN